MNSNRLVAVGLTVVFTFLAWWRGRSSKGFGPQIVRLILFAVAFVLGEIYLIVLFADLKWPRLFAFVAIAAWGVLLIWGRGFRSLRVKTGSELARK